MDILNNEKEYLFDSIFNDEVRIDNSEELNKSYYPELFSVIAENNSEDTHSKFIETSMSISVNDYLLSQKNILKIINE